MGGRAHEFSLTTMKDALKRQKGFCGSCGTRIVALGNAGVAQHEFGERAHAHHIRPIHIGGQNDVANCVIICSSCHYTVHEGGNYRGTVFGKPTDYPHYRG